MDIQFFKDRFKISDIGVKENVWKNIGEIATVFWTVSYRQYKLILFLICLLL